MSQEVTLTVTNPMEPEGFNFNHTEVGCFYVILSRSQKGGNLHKGDIVFVLSVTEHCAKVIAFTGHGGGGTRVSVLPQNYTVRPVKSVDITVEL